MDLLSSSWTFPVPGSEALVAALPDWEGLLLLNPTAAWIWQRRTQPDLPFHYSEHFGISMEQAQADLATVLESWQQISPPPLLPTPPARFELYSAGLYRIERTTFLVRFATEDLADELAPRLAALDVSLEGATPALEHTPDYTIDLIEHDDHASVFRDGVCFATEPLITGARAVLLQELARLAVPGRDFGAILHAGAIGNTQASIILAGASFSGKSTLCAALMLSGLLCYSDDSAALTLDYQIAGLPFALSLREGSWPLFPHLDRPRFLPSNLRRESPTAPPVGLLFVQYDPSASVLTLEPVELFDALIALEQSGFWVNHTQPAIAAFLSWLAQLPIYRLCYSNLDAAVAKIHQVLNTGVFDEGTPEEPRSSLK